MAKPMDPNDAIQSLARIAAAAARLMALMHSHSGVVDPDAEVDHMQANLDHVRAQIVLARRWQE